MLRKYSYKHFILTSFTIILLYQLVSFISNNHKLFPSIFYIITISFKEIGLFHENSSEPSNYYAFLVLLKNTFFTIRRVVISLIISFIMGLSFGVGIHYFKIMKSCGKILLNILKGIPLFALIPLFLFWFGGGEFGVIVYITFAISILLSITTFEAIYNLPSKYIWFRKIYNLSKRNYYWHIIIPGILPEIISAMKVISGLLFAFSLGAEMYGNSKGLGNLVYYAFIHSSMGKLYIYCFVYIILGISFLSILNYIEKTFLNWINYE